MERKKRGRPKEKVIDKISIDYDQLVLLVSTGYTDAELAKFFKKSKRTIDRWKSDSEFLSHLKKGKELADNKVERALFERATGYNHKDVHINCYEGDVIITDIIKYYPPDPTSCIFWLKNRKPKDWRDTGYIDDGDNEQGGINFDGWELD